MSDILIVGPFAATLAAKLAAARAAPAAPAALAAVSIAAAESIDQPELDLASVRALIALPQVVDRALLARMPKLEWLQTITAGIDALTGVELGGIALSTMSGVHAPQMAELAFMYMLSLARDLRGVFARQAAAEWRPAPQPLLAWAHVVIVGVGGIAEGVARRCQAFEMRVTGVSGSRTAAPGFDLIVPPERLIEIAALADYLIVLSPYSPRNHHLVSSEVIDALRPEAVLINIARGPVVDERALVRALEEKRIAGAGLDVFDREPLPPEHPFWRMSNVIVTPHIGGWSSRLADQVTPLIVANVGRWFGSPRRGLVNQVRT